MKKLLTLGLALLSLLGGLFSGHKFGTLPGSFWTLTNGSLFPIGNSNLASSTTPIANGFFTNLTVNGVCTGCATASSTQVGTLQQVTNLGNSTTNTIALLNGLTVSGDVSSTNGAFTVYGTTGSASVSGAGTRLMWIPDKATLAVGTVGDSRWDEGSIGSNSYIFGTDSQANNNSFTWGLLSRAIGNVSLALGNQADAQGDSAIAVGPFTGALQLYSSAFGNHVTSTAQGATTLGEWCSNSGTASTVICAQSPSSTYNFTANNKIGMVGETQFISTSSTSVPLTVLDNAGRNILSVASTTLSIWGGLALPQYISTSNLDGFTIGSYTGNAGFVDIQGGNGNGGVIIRKIGSPTEIVAQLGRSLALTNGSVTTTYATTQLVFGQQAGFTGGTFTLDQSGNISASGTASLAGGSAGKATCWKADGRTIGFCSTQPDAGGNCTCN